ncbi:MAG: glutamine amidotransferase [bacterium]|nr:glutamine amidotransferase [bacterium]
MLRARQTILSSALLLALVACQAAPAGEGNWSSGPATSMLDDLVKTAGERRLTAAFLIVDGVYNTELTAPFDVLQHTIYHAPNGLGIEVFTISPDGRAVTTAEGLNIQADHSFANAPAIDLLVVPSAEASRDKDLEREDLIEWVAATGERAGGNMSLCWGAFVLAQAGLLDDTACTTFPSDYDTFTERFPALDLRINVSFVHSGKTITSQGGARSFDAAMYLVDRLYGEQVAAGVGGGLLIPWPPDDDWVPYLVSEPK